MKENRARYFVENMERLGHQDRIFLNNPVVLQGLGLAPIVITATTLQNAAIIAAAVALILTPTRLLENLIGRGTGYRFRALTYCLTAGVVYVGASFLLEQFFGLSLGNVGIFLPLLVMEPLIIKRHLNQQREKLSTSFERGILLTLGFTAVLFIVAGLRELMAYGTLAGVEVVRFQLLPMADMAAGGFILTGLVAALWRGVISRFKKWVNMEVKKLT